MAIIKVETCGNVREYQVVNGSWSRRGKYEYAVILKNGTAFKVRRVLGDKIFKVVGLG